MGYTADQQQPADRPELEPKQPNHQPCHQPRHLDHQPAANCAAEQHISATEPSASPRAFSPDPHHQPSPNANADHKIRILRNLPTSLPRKLLPFSKHHKVIYKLQVTEHSHGSYKPTNSMQEENLEMLQNTSEPVRSRQGT